MPIAHQGLLMHESKSLIILKYYGTFGQAQKFMLLFCKKTNSFWKKYEKYFHKELPATKYTENELKEIEEFKTSFWENINEPDNCGDSSNETFSKDQYELDTEDESHNNFLFKYKWYPPMSNIEHLIIKMDNKTNQDLICFISNMKLSQRLISVLISSSDRRLLRIPKKFYESVLLLAETPKLKISFINKILTGRELADVMIKGSSSTLEHFVLSQCKVIEAEGFKLDTLIQYKFEILKIFGSISSYEDMKVIASEMAKTNLKNTLKKITVSSSSLESAKEAFENFK